MRTFFHPSSFIGHWKSAAKPPELFGLAAALLCVLLFSHSVRPSSVEVLAQYEGTESAHSVTLPFALDKESDYMRVNMVMHLNALHVSTFHVGPDDCIEEFIVNGEEVVELKGLCNMSPGYIRSLPNLQSGVNILNVRLHDTGGTGGMSFTESVWDPLLLIPLLCAALLAAWLIVRTLGMLGIPFEWSALCVIVLLSTGIHLSLSGHGGFGGDIYLNQEWGKSAAAFGLIESYDNQLQPDILKPNYPPLSMLMFQSVAESIQQFVHEDYSQASDEFHFGIKLPAMLADLFSIVILFVLLRGIRGKKAALVAAGVYALHPAVLHNSAVWGQTDAIFTLWLLLMLLCMTRKRFYLAGIAFCMGMLFKMQTIILAPILAMAALLQPKRIVLSFLGAVTIAIPAILPFYFDDALDTFLGIYKGSVGFYSSLSSNAYNLWVALYGRETGKAATDAFLYGIDYRTTGLALWGATILYVLIAWRKTIHMDIEEKGRTGMLMLASATIAYSFFLFNAEMHERYLFPMMALGLPLLLTGWRGITLYFFSSLFFTLNLISIVAFFEFDRVHLQDRFNEYIPSIAAWGHLVTFILLLMHLQLYHRSHLPKKEHRSKKAKDRLWIGRKGKTLSTVSA